DGSGPPGARRRVLCRGPLQRRAPDLRRAVRSELRRAAAAGARARMERTTRRSGAPLLEIARREIDAGAGARIRATALLDGRGARGRDAARARAPVSEFRG